MLKPGGLLVTASGFVTRDTLVALPEHAKKTLCKERPDIFDDLYEETVLAGFREIDSTIIGYKDTDDDESGVADLARSLGVNVRFTEYVRLCKKQLL